MTEITKQYIRELHALRYELGVVQARVHRSHAAYRRGLFHGALATCTVFIATAATVALLRPAELAPHALTPSAPIPDVPTFTPQPPVDLGPCDPRGKDCVHFPGKKAPYPETYYTPEPGSLALVAIAGLAGLATARKQRKNA